MVLNPRVRWAGCLTLIAVLLLQPSSRALAQGETPPGDENCRTCHEDLYYLHDTGKWYCLCEIPPTCIDCHGGQPVTLDEALAHAGLIANPLQNRATACQACHPEEHEERLAKFTRLAGGSVIAGDSPPPSWPGSHTLTSPNAPTWPPVPVWWIPARLLEPWRLIALGLTGMGLVVMGMVAIRSHPVNDN